MKNTDLKKIKYYKAKFYWLYEEEENEKEIQKWKKSHINQKWEMIIKNRIL